MVCVLCLCFCPIGVVMFDKTQGFWLSHTVPHFPPFPERGFGYPSTGMFYGQVLFCVTYSYEQFHAICKENKKTNEPSNEVWHYVSVICMSTFLFCQAVSVHQQKPSGFPRMIKPLVLFCHIHIYSQWWVNSAVLKNNIYAVIYIIHFSLFFYHGLFPS